MGLTTHRGKAVLAQLLTLGCFGLSFLLPAPPLSYIGLAIGVAGVAIAASNRLDAMPWAQTHHEHVLRSILIGACVWTLGSLMAMFGLTRAYVIWVYLAVLLWIAIRAGVGLVLAILRKPIPHPKGMLL